MCASVFTVIMGLKPSHSDYHVSDLRVSAILTANDIVSDVKLLLKQMTVSQT
jgi:hypothetical protein